MRNIFNYPILSFILLMIISCSSINDDAKRAAKLSKKSIQYTKEMKFDKAEQAYKESQKYFQKYKEKKKIKEFTKAYNESLLK